MELEPIVELGLNAEQLVDSLALLSRTFGHLLNQSGYSGADIILEDVIIPYHLVSIDCGLLGPLEAALNDQLNKLERIATTQLALAKKGAFPFPFARLESVVCFSITYSFMFQSYYTISEERVNLLGRQYIDKLQRRLAVEEKEFAALVVAVPNLLAALSLINNIVLCSKVVLILEFV